MRKTLLLLPFLALFLTACTPVQAPSDTAPADTAMMEEEPAGNDIYGSWLRTAIYVDGALEGNEPANLTLNADGSYNSSTALCATSGTQVVTGNSIAVSMTQSSCPGGLPLPYNVTYTFTIAEDGESMSMMTANVKEDYVRAE